MLDVKIEEEEFKDVYEVASEIGRGKFAVVKECRHKKKDCWYAAKVIRKRRKGVDCRAEVLQEVNMLRVTLSHPHFVDLIEVYETRHEMVIITELMRGGELFQHITSEGQLEEGYTITIMRQVLNGLSFLHSQEIAHLDIKPQNILLTNESLDCKIKLCDLGLARNVNRADLFEIIGTPDYLAPEILDYQKLSVACDMWSTGVLAYVMLSGYSPFAGDTNQETYLNISQVNLDFPESFFSNVSITAIEFIQSLLIKEPDSRLKVDECLRHAWVTAPCPPSPNEHEPVKRIRFEEDDAQVASERQASGDLPVASGSGGEGAPTTSQTILSIPLLPVCVAKSADVPVESSVVISEDMQQKDSKRGLENDSETTPDDKKPKDNFKSQLNFSLTSPTSPLNYLPSITAPRLSPRTPPSPRRSTTTTTLSSSPSSTFPATIASNPTTIEHTLFTDTDILHDIDSSSPIHLSPFSPGSPKLHSSELTPHLSRTKFWKDSSSEPSGISV